MNLKHKPRGFSRIFLALFFLLIAGSFIVSNGSMIYADDENESGVTVQNTDDEKMTEEMAQKIKEMMIITIDNKGYKKDRKGPAKFEHVKHAREYAISCWECHHEYNKDEQVKQPEKAEATEGSEQMAKDEKPLPKERTNQNIWSPWGITKKCSECHDPQEKKDDVIKLQAAYHKNCKNCHIDRKIYGSDVLAYRKCTSCHE